MTLVSEPMHSIRVDCSRAWVARTSSCAAAGGKVDTGRGREEEEEGKTENKEINQVEAPTHAQKQRHMLAGTIKIARAKQMDTPSVPPFLPLPRSSRVRHVKVRGPLSRGPVVMAVGAP